MLVVGLGNPGQKYSRTRHNVGFQVVDAFALQQKARVDSAVCQAIIGTASAGNTLVRIAKPITYMNESGVAVSCLLRRFSLQVEQLLVVHDDVDIPLGKVRVSRNRGDAGHLGVRSIAQHVGGEQFSRIRVGVGRPPDEVSVRDHVLGEFFRYEIPLVGQMITCAVGALHEVILSGLDVAMEQYNAASPP